jgi:hypothetical protein
MRKPANIVLLVVIVALLPLRSIAAAMAGSCAVGQAQIAAAQSIGDAQDSQAGSGKADTHCSSAVFLPAAAPAPLSTRSDERGTALAEPKVSAFIPDQLDPPPLSLPR